MEAVVAPILTVVNDHPYLCLSSAVLGYATLTRFARPRSRRHLPPGPKGYPIIGNLPDLPLSHAWEKLGDLGKQYGPFFFFFVFLIVTGER